MISNKERVSILILLLIIALSGVYVSKRVFVIQKSDQHVTFEESYQPSFFESILSSLNLASAYTSLEGGMTGRVPYVEVIQHDDIAQLTSADSGKARKDFVPDYAKIASVAARASGKWSEVFGGYQFSPDTIVLIPEGINIIYDIESTDPIKGIAIKGKLTLDPSRNVSMKVGTIILYPNASYEDKPISSVNHKVVFSGSIDKTIDPFQMTIGLITFGGDVDIQGKAVDTYAKIISSGGSTMTVDSASGWKGGDSIIIYEDPNANALNLKQQIIKISSVQGNQINLAEPIKINPSRFAVMASRNVVFKSDDKGDRGQMMFLAKTTVDVKNIAIVDLGRTTTSVTVNAKKAGDTYTPGENQIGRYPFHAHHLQSKFVLEGSVVYGERNEKVFAYPNNSRRVINDIPLSVYVYGGQDPLTDGQMDPVIWPTAHDVVASSNGRWWLLYNPTGEFPAPTAEASGFAPYKTRIGDGGNVETLRSNGEWVKTGWVKYKAVPKDGAIYGDGSVSTGIKVIDIPLASPRWGIVNHNSFGDVINNVVVGAEGSGITTEEGMEFGKIDSNLVVGLGGGTGQNDDLRWWGFGLKKVDLGYGGHAYWHASMLFDFTNNVADGFFRFGTFTFYHPYDINGAVPSINNANQFKFPSIPGMPQELAGFQGFVSGVRKMDNNISYAETGHDGTGLTLINVGPSDFETSNPYTVISNFTLYHKGVSLTGSAPVTFKGFKLYGDGKGVGINAHDTETTIIDSQVKNFDNGVYYSRHSVRIIDSIVDNIKSTPTAYAKIYYDTMAKIKERLAKNFDVYAKEALVANKDAEYVAVLDHDNVKSPVALENPAIGWATINIDKVNQTVVLKWDIKNAKYPLQNIDVVVPSRDKGIPSVTADKLKRVFFVADGKLAYSGTYIVKKDEIESGRYFPGKYENVKAVTFDEFIKNLDSGQVEIRLITHNIGLVGSGAWPEAQGKFIPTNKPTTPVVDPKPTEPATNDNNQTPVSIGQTPKPIDSTPLNPTVDSPTNNTTNTAQKTPTVENKPVVNSTSNTTTASTQTTTGSKYIKATNGFTIQGGDPTLSASKVGSSDNKTSTNTFSPGSYNGNPNDWTWDITINTPAGRKIYQILITDGESTWSTNQDIYWPLVAFKSGTQMHSTRSDPFVYTDQGSNRYTLYGQQRSTTYKPVTITIQFDQGDSIVLEGVK